VAPSDGTLVFQQDSKELLLRQGGSWNGVVTEGSILRSLPQRPPDGEALLKQAVWWIDAAHNSSSGQTIKNLGWGGSVLDARNGSAAGADSNDALFLDWSGENYVYLPGVAGNTMTVPSFAAIENLTADIDIRMEIQLDTYRPSSNLPLLWRAGADPNRYVVFRLGQTGLLSLNWFPDGTNASSLVSTATVALADSPGARLWVRATLDVDNGASGNDVQFFTSTDGVTWTQLGATVTKVNTTTLASAVAPVRIEEFHAGRFYRAQILDGINGTKVLDVDTSVITAGNQTTFNALTGQTVTINRSTAGRKSVAVVAPVWLFGTDDYMEVPDNDLIDFGASDSFTVVAVMRQWNNTATSSAVVAKKVSGALGAGWYLRRINNATAQLTLDDGTTQYSTFQPSLPTAGQLFIISGVRDTVADTGRVYVDSTAGSATTDTTSLTLANSEVMRVGRLSGAGTSYTDMELVAAAVFRRALTSGEITALTTYFQNRIGA
jgi:hypothetical protein